MNPETLRNPHEPEFDFGMEDFDINAAFQGALSEVASDAELLLEEKVRRVEVILSEGSSELYRDFVDFTAMASQIEMMCSHDHALNQSVQENSLISGFMNGHAAKDDHEHGKGEEKKKKEKDKKKKKKQGWFGITL